MHGKLRNWSRLFAAFLVLAGLASSAQASGFICTSNAGVPAEVRADGLTELLSDLTLSCSGGTPTPAGQAFPQFNFTVLLNTNVTSRVVAGEQFSEALLIVDDPASATNPDRPVLNCGNAGAPDSGMPGPGVCAIVSSGNPASSYDGTPNGFGSAACDGAGGRPPANTYGCGRPNIFQGRIGTPATPGQLNAVTFFNVPVDPPGDGATRRFRITNLRANASSVGVSQTSVFSTIQATIAAVGPIPLAIGNPLQIVAFVGAGLVTNSSSCVASAPSRIRVCEGFGSVWKPKNVSFAVGNGVPGNASRSISYWSYNGGTNYPPDAAQNVPGSIYNTESAFEWQNNSTNGPPNPNPPFGFGTVPVKPGEVAPLSSAGFGGLNTGITGAGIGDAGTRITVRFTGIPAGASVQVPTLVYIFPTYPGDPTYANGSTGAMALTNTDSAGAGVYSPGTAMLPGNLAVYEVLWADPFAIEYAEIPYALIGGSGATVQVTAGDAPFYSDSGSQQNSSTYPVPRFLDSNFVCGGQSCLNVSPSQGLNSGPIQLTLTYYGSQALTGAQVLLRGTGFPDILGTSPSNPAANVLAATFDLGSAPLGARDVIISPTSGPTIALAGGLSVLQTPACAYSVGPQSIHAPATGASGSLVVSASSPQCPWTANTTASWITLGAVSPNLSVAQPYSIPANSGSSQLTGTIMIAGQSIPVVQDAASSTSCSYSINSASDAFGVNGGTFTVNVTAPPGCAWSTVSSLTWVSFPSGSSGTGNGSVTIQVGVNTVGFLSGTLTIAGQPFAVSQDASPCGGTDVSRQVSGSLQALLSNWNYAGPYTQQLHLTNQGPAVPGPISVVFYAVCEGLGFFCPFRSPSAPSAVQCQPGQAYYPVVLVSPAGLAAGQTIFFGLQFSVNPYGGMGSPLPGSISYSVISGTPGP
jgi:hypothetical protein